MLIKSLEVFADGIPRQLKMTKSSISHGGNQPASPAAAAAPRSFLVVLR